jgi:hypothetical protein
MKHKTVLNYCLATEWICIVAGVLASFALEAHLPQPLQAWLAQEAETPLGVEDNVMLVACFPLIISMVVASVGLFAGRKWAAWVYLVTSVLGILVMTLTGPTVAHAIPDTLDDISVAMSGMVIALAFFTDALEKVAEPSSPLVRVSRDGKQM